MGAGVFHHAWSERRRLRDAGPEIVLAGLTGGPASLVDGTVASRLVTVLDPGADVPSTWSLRWWLEWRQARHSALIVAPDRTTAVATALRLSLDLSRIRIERDPTSVEAQARLQRELNHRSSSRGAWHSAGR